MIRCVKARLHKAGLAERTSKETMRDEDALIIALIMLKLCRNNFVAISTFICILVNIAGRGSETAILTFAELAIIPHEIDYQKSSIIQVLFWHDKTGHYQNPRIFPQADKGHWYKDIYFMLALSLIYQCAGIYREDTITSVSLLVPKFFDEAKKEEKNTEKRTVLELVLFLKCLVTSLRK